MDTTKVSIIGSLRSLLDKVIILLPNLLTAVVILVLGLIISLLLKWGVHRLLRALGVDGLSARIGTARLLREAGLPESVSLLASRFLGGLTLVVFVIASLLALNVPTSERLFERFLLYLPNVLVAIVILLVGFAVANFVGRAALIASVNAGLKTSGLLARLARLAIMLIALTMALEQLGVARETITIAFATVFGGVVLAVALALGLGGQQIAKRYLEKRFGRDENDSDITHI